MTVVVTALMALGHMLLGEGPVWIERDQSLMFVDITGEYIYRYFNETERVQRLKLYDTSYLSSSTIIIPVNGSTDHYIATIGKQIISVQWSPNDTDHITRIPKVIIDLPGPANLRFNDGKCDPRGRLWTGTMVAIGPMKFSPKKGHLYRMENDTSMTPILENITIPNGLAWNTERTKFFYIDSDRQQIAVFDYEDETGEISNRRVLFDFVDNGLNDQLPDGMDIDSNDNLWVACFNGFQVINIDTKTGQLIRSVSLPSRSITSCVFGGKDYSTLYVTSAGLTADHEELKKYPLSGQTFKVSGLGVSGVPPNECVIDKKFLQ